MPFQHETPASPQPAKAPSNGRLEALAAIWARQTGRSIVVSPSPPRACGC